MKSNSIIILISFFLICYSCRHNQNKLLVAKGQLTKAGFDFKYWQSDTLGCDAIRKKNNADILVNYDSLKYYNKNEVISLLGKPHKIRDINNYTLVYYVVDGRIICDLLKHKKVVDVSDVSCFVLTFSKKDSLLNTRFMYP